MASQSYDFKREERGPDSAYGGSDIGDDDDQIGIFGETKHTLTRGRQSKHPGAFITTDAGKLTENDVTEICEHIAPTWKDLGRELGFTEASLQNINGEHKNDKDRAHALLIKYMRRQGSEATKERLACALANYRVGRRDVAEMLVGCNWSKFKSQNQQIFFLTEEGRFNSITQDSQTTFHVCRNFDGRLFLARELKGSQYEEACQTLQKEDGIADSLLKALSPNGIVKEEKERKRRKELEGAQAKLLECKESLEEIKRCLGGQERQEDRIRVREQLREAEKMIHHMQLLSSEFLRLSSCLSNLPEAIGVMPKVYDFSIDLSATYKDLEQAIQLLLDMAKSDSALLDATDTVRLTKAYDNCKSMGRGIKMRERFFESHFEEDIRLAQLPHSSESEPCRRPEEECLQRPMIRRASTQPVSQSELRSIANEVSPPHERTDDQDLLNQLSQASIGNPSRN